MSLISKFMNLSEVPLCWFQLASCIVLTGIGGQVQCCTENTFFFYCTYHYLYLACPGVIPIGRMCRHLVNKEILTDCTNSDRQGITISNPRLQLKGRRWGVWEKVLLAHLILATHDLACTWLLSIVYIRIIFHQTPLTSVNCLHRSINIKGCVYLNTLNVHVTMWVCLMILVAL